MPYYYNFKASPRLPLGLSQIIKFECVTLRVLKCCTNSPIGCLFNNGSMNFNLSLPSLVFFSLENCKMPHHLLSMRQPIYANTEIQLRMGL